MTENTDLWADFGADKIVPPLQYLREQAALIGKKTNYVLRGEVRTRSPQMDTNLYHTMYILAPALDNYLYEVLEIRHDRSIYPVTMSSGDAGIYSQVLNNEREFLDTLGKVLKAEKIREIINGLLLQSKS